MTSTTKAVIFILGTAALSIGLVVGYGRMEPTTAYMTVKKIKQGAVVAQSVSNAIINVANALGGGMVSTAPRFAEILAGD